MSTINQPNLAARSDLERQVDLLVQMPEDQRENILWDLSQQASTTPDGKYYLRALQAMLRSKLESLAAGVSTHEMS
ncbi:MAG: hypothetical protein GKR94_16730 [Gammaproteobacteria bacterium]|nr:hypothetical protein [Gammaproteobacteria bacterium]